MPVMRIRMERASFKVIIQPRRNGIGRRPVRRLTWPWLPAGRVRIGLRPFRPHRARGGPADPDVRALFILCTDHVTEKRVGSDFRLQAGRQPLDRTCDTIGLTAETALGSSQQRHTPDRGIQHRRPEPGPPKRACPIPRESVRAIAVRQDVILSGLSRGFVQ